MRRAILVLLLTAGCNSSEHMMMRAQCAETCPAVFCNEDTGACEIVAPDTTITTAPPALATSAEAMFQFASAAGATFTCKLDGVTVACTASSTFTVGDGAHTLEVTAVLGGTSDPTPATHSWTVDTGPPTVTISAPAQGAVTGPNVAIAFSSSETSTYECTLDGAAVPDCVPGIPLTGLASGMRTFTVRATDGFGNQSTVASVTFRVNRAPTLAVIPEQNIDEDTGIDELALIIADEDDTLDSLEVTHALSDEDVFLLDNTELFSKVGGARFLQMVPSLNANGATEVTITVSDGDVIVSRTFTVNVDPVNDAPTISAIGTVHLDPGASSSAIPFTVFDVDGDTLEVSASTEGTTLLPAGSLVLGGSGQNRTITVTPASQQGGTTSVQVTVKDPGEESDEASFTVEVEVRLAASASPPGGGTVAITGTGCTGAATCDRMPGAGAVTFSASPAGGFGFDGWTGDCSGTGDFQLATVPTSWRTCTAQFSALPAEPDLWATTVQTAGEHPGLGMVVLDGLFHFLTAGDLREMGPTMHLVSLATGDGQLAGESLVFFESEADTALVPVALAGGKPDLVALVQRSGGDSALVTFTSEGGVSSAEALPVPDQRTVSASGGELTVLPGGAIVAADDLEEDGQGASVRLVLRDGDKALERLLCGHNEACDACPDTRVERITPFGDEGFLVLSRVDGTTLSSSLALFDPAGALKWHKSLAMADNGQLVLHDVIPVADGVVLVGEVLGSREGPRDLAIVKVDAEGTMTADFRTTTSETDERAASALVDKEGRIVVTGSIDGDLLVFAVDPESFEVSAASQMGGERADHGSFLVANPERGYFLLGGSTSFPKEGEGELDPWALWIDDDLTIVFNEDSGAVLSTPELVFEPAGLAENPLCPDGDFAEIELTPIEVTIDKVGLSQLYQAP